MMTDVALLREYASTRDPDAFEELVRRYAGMVYATCLRVTRNPHDAEDVAQECFLQLARKAGNITSSLPGWLHRTATNRALDAIRKSSARQRREEAVATEMNHHVNGPTWAEIAPSVDAALEELPDDFRVPLILHYLEGKSQIEIAQAFGIHQATVSRRIHKGVDQLRNKLKKAGVIATVAVLSTQLAEKAACAAPDTLMASLGKMAAAGIGGTAAAAGAAAASGGAKSSLNLLPTIPGTTKGKAALVIAAAAVMVTAPFIARKYTSDHGTRLAATIPAERHSPETAAADESKVPAGTEDKVEPVRNQTGINQSGHTEVPPGRTAEQGEPSGEKTRVENWREDLRYLAAELPRRHLNLFFQLPEEEFQAAVAELDRTIPTLTDTEIRLSLAQLVAKVGNDSTNLDGESPSVHWYPLELRLFTDGLFVVGTSREKYKSALGCRVVRIGNADIDDAIEAVAHFIPHENEMWVKAECPRWLTNADVLHMEGIVPSRDSATFLLEDREGHRFSLEVGGLTKSEIRKAPSLSVFDGEDSSPPVSHQRNENYWSGYLKRSNALYLQYNLCAEMPEQSFRQFAWGVARFLETQPVERLILDLRHNRGGNSEIINPLIDRILNHHEINSWGRFYVIIGRNTGGAAVTDAIRLLKKTNPILVGEPTGGKPNTYSEQMSFHLPNSRICVTYSTEYFHLLAEDAPSVFPGISVEMSSEDFFARRDPVLERILELTEEDLAAVAAGREARAWKPFECDDKRIIGAWIGTLEADQGKKWWQVVLRFSENSEGSVLGFLRLLELGAGDIRVNSGYFRDGKLRVSVSQLNELLFQGTMKENGSAIEGEAISFGGVAAPLTLRPITDTDLERVAQEACSWEPIEADDDRIVGAWAGTITGGQETMRLVFHFERNPQGELLGFLDSPDQGVTGARMTNGTFRNDILRLTWEPIGFQFRGKMAEDGRAIRGEVHQGGGSVSIILSRQ